MMPKKLSLKIAVLFIFVLTLSFSVSAAYAVTMNGKEVIPYVGHIVSHNNRTGEVVIKTDKSTGHWRLHRNVVVLNEGKANERLYLEEIWRNTRTVKVWVSRDGEVQRISVLEWK